MKQFPKVSVIIPVYNGELYLADAIQNVINQQYKPLEIIVVDDGSKDNTAQIANKFEDVIKYIYQENKGPAAARNTGIKLAQGDIIAFLDADDLWSDNKLKIQIEYLINNPSISIVIGHTQGRKLQDNEESKTTFVNFNEPYLIEHLGSTIFLKSVFEQVGLFDEELYYSEDLDWFSRAKELQMFIKIHEEVVLFYRRHNNNLTNNKRLQKHYHFRMLKKALDRRRKQNNGIAIAPMSLSKMYQQQ